MNTLIVNILEKSIPETTKMLKLLFIYQPRFQFG